jgi:D-alanyl-D-alanine dipeptidase
MTRRRTLIIGLAALALTACAHHAAIPRNEYGLTVISDVVTYRQTVAADPDKQLIDVAATAPGIKLDVRYATTNNFMHEQLYPVARIFLRRPAALALRDVQQELAAQQLGLQLFDGYRPYRVTRRMWEPYKNPDFVADPAKGSRHNRGAAVDLTLIDLRTGQELAMPTPYDDFTTRARQDFNELPSEVIRNRALLRDVMVKHGFLPLPSEWWHFDFGGWEKFELLDVDLQELP